MVSEFHIINYRNIGPFYSVNTVNIGLRPVGFLKTGKKKKPIMPAYEGDERVGSIVHGPAEQLSEWLSEVKREAGCDSDVWNPSTWKAEEAGEGWG